MIYGHIQLMSGHSIDPRVQEQSSRAFRRARERKIRKMSPADREFLLKPRRHLYLEKLAKAKLDSPD